MGDDSPLVVFGCSDVLIGNTKFGEVLQVSEMGPNLLSIYYISHTNKKVTFGQINRLSHQ